MERPCFCAGDEFMHTQRGNNNPYNQDNETTWLDWDKLRVHGDVFRFFKQMIAFRESHPSLCRSRFWREDVNWYGMAGQTDRSNHSHTLAFCVHGAAQDNTDIYVMVNAYWDDLDFWIQEGPAEAWRRVVDTALGSPDDICDPAERTRLSSPRYAVTARSIVVLEKMRPGATT